MHCEDIGDHEVLADISERAGLDREAILRLLESDSDRDDIQARDAHARERGVQAVPTFIVGNRHAVPGAQPPARRDRPAPYGYLRQDPAARKPVSSPA